MKYSFSLPSPKNIFCGISRFFWSWVLRINFVFDKKEIHVGDYYTDCGHIPRKAIKADPFDLIGISLIDGTEGSCSVHYCVPEKITKEQAEEIAINGPLDPKIKKYLKDFYASEWGNGRTIWWKE